MKTLKPRLNPGISGRAIRCRLTSVGPVKLAIPVLVWCIVLIDLAVPKVVDGAALDLTTSSTLLPNLKTSVESEIGDTILSPYWGPEIQQWGDTIGTLSDIYGFHPDFIAAVIQHEMEGEDQTIINVGVFGSMKNLATAPDLNERMSSEEILAPETNLRWGMAILSYVVQQSGGDLFTALAAYNGGWGHINGPSAREYAARVLDSYARAIMVRNGLSPELAGRWTVAVEIRAGNVPSDSLLLLGVKPIVGWRTFAEHTVYAFASPAGHAFYVRGFVVPLSLSELAQHDRAASESDGLEAPLRARLGEKSARSAAGNPRVILACLPTLPRLQGQVTTRWYAPSGCPDDGR